MEHVFGNKVSKTTSGEKLMKYQIISIIFLEIQQNHSFFIYVITKISMFKRWGLRTIFWIQSTYTKCLERGYTIGENVSMLSSIESVRGS